MVGGISSWVWLCVFSVFLVLSVRSVLVRFRASGRFPFAFVPFLVTVALTVVFLLVGLGWL